MAVSLDRLEKLSSCCIFRKFKPLYFTLPFTAWQQNLVFSDWKFVWYVLLQGSLGIVVDFSSNAAVKPLTFFNEIKSVFSCFSMQDYSLLNTISKQHFYIRGFFSPPLSSTISCYANRAAGKNGNSSALKSPKTNLFFFFCQNICGLILEFGTWAVKLIQSQWWSTTHCILCYFVSCSSCHLFNTFTFSSHLLKQKPMYLLLYDREWRQHFFLFLPSLRQQSG